MLVSALSFQASLLCLRTQTTCSLVCLFLHTHTHQKSAAVFCFHQADAVNSAQGLCFQPALSGERLVGLPYLKLQAFRIPSDRDASSTQHPAANAFGVVSN